MGGWVYIMTNRPFGTLYVGVTSDIVRRTWDHRHGMGSAFTSRYHLTRLVYMERHEEILAAFHRETRFKHSPRQWKLNLIEVQNPTPCVREVAARIGSRPQGALEDEHGSVWTDV
ncbi:MAG: GIY-YIG nuclease family protein [Acetobacteraceae bacterium]|nr:GIY-YIG nuclease family protein [Acetobacteraceae bacterium]